MRRNKMKIEFDGIGYVNNRGTSKYWGVCKALDDDKNYRITVKDGKDTYTFHPDFKLGRITEQVAAQLAAALYKYRFERLPAFVNVEIGDKVYRMDSLSKKIYEVFGCVGTKIEKPVDEQEAAFVVSEPIDLLNKMMKDYHVDPSEQRYITDVFSKVTGGELSYRGKKVLSAVLRSVV